MKFYIFLVFLVFLFTACSPAFSSVHPYNTIYKKQKAHKAFVTAGSITKNGYKIEQVFLVGNKQTREEAVDLALENCRKKALKPKECKLYDVDDSKIK